MTPSFTAAVVQAAPIAFDLDATLDKVARLASEAAGRGARLVVFPEAFVSCYPRGLDFGTVIGARTLRTGGRGSAATGSPRSTSPARQSIGSARSPHATGCTW